MGWEHAVVLRKRWPIWRVCNVGKQRRSVTSPGQGGTPRPDDVLEPEQPVDSPVPDLPQRFRRILNLSRPFHRDPTGLLGVQTLPRQRLAELGLNGRALVVQGVKEPLVPGPVRPLDGGFRPSAVSAEDNPVLNAANPRREGPPVVGLCFACLGEPVLRPQPVNQLLENAW